MKTRIIILLISLNVTFANAQILGLTNQKTLNIKKDNDNLYQIQKTSFDIKKDIISINIYNNYRLTFHIDSTLTFSPYITEVGYQTEIEKKYNVKLKSPLIENFVDSLFTKYKLHSTRNIIGRGHHKTTLIYNDSIYNLHDSGNATIREYTSNFVDTIYTDNNLIEYLRDFYINLPDLKRPGYELINTTNTIGKNTFHEIKSNNQNSKSYSKLIKYIHTKYFNKKTNEKNVNSIFKNHPNVSFTDKITFLLVDMIYFNYPNIIIGNKNTDEERSYGGTYTLTTFKELIKNQPFTFQEKEKTIIINLK